MLLEALRVWSRGSSIRPFIEEAGVGWPLSGPAVLSATLVDVAGLGVLKPKPRCPFPSSIESIAILAVALGGRLNRPCLNASCAKPWHHDASCIVKDMNQTITGSWDPKYALDGDLQTKLMLHVGYSPLVEV